VHSAKKKQRVQSPLFAMIRPQLVHSSCGGDYRHFHVNHSFLLGNIGGFGDVTETCKWAKFCDNKGKLENKVMYKAALPGVKLFDTA